MKKYIFNILFIIIIFFQNIKHSVTADLDSIYKTNVPLINSKLFKQKNTNNHKIIINSNHATGKYPDNITYSGNVDVNLSQDGIHLKADKVQFNQKKIDNTNHLLRTVNALGNVYFDSDQIKIRGLKGWMNLNNKNINIWQCHYQMVGRQGHGNASLIKQRNEGRYTIVENGSFTSCLPDSNIWSIIGNKVIYDHKEQVAKIWNAYFKLGSIYIFYSPYLQLPIGNKRCSGFLIPQIKYSTLNQLTLYVPYYWNIAPNIDVVITPHYIYKRGSFMLENELQYLTYNDTGSIKFNFIPLDKIFKNKHQLENNGHRWLFHWKHATLVNNSWYFNVDYTKTSDPMYFSDFEPNYDFIHRYNKQIINVGYFNHNFKAVLSMKHFQKFKQEDTNNSINNEQQLAINFYRNNLGPLRLSIYGQLAHLVNINSNMPELIRLHVEPVINLLLQFPTESQMNINAEAKLMSTYYQQENLDKYNKEQNFNLKHFVNRNLPQFKIDSKILLKRNLNKKNGYIQTLEPHIQYLYIPYKDQSQIINYDSSFIQFADYDSLFSNRTYSGLDRISSANQMIFGVTSRIYDKKMIERANISIGNIYYLTTPRSIDDKIHWNKKNKKDCLVWINDVYWSITDHWKLSSNLQLDKRLDNIRKISSSIEYFYDKLNSVKLSFIYSNKEYFNQAKLLTCCYDYKDNHKKEILSQIGTIVTGPISNNWSIVGRYCHDIKKNKPVERLLKLKYNSCCYAINFSYERRCNNWNTGIKDKKENENIIGFSMELRGIHSNYA